MISERLALTLPRKAFCVMRVPNGQGWFRRALRNSDALSFGHQRRTSSSGTCKIKAADARVREIRDGGDTIVSIEERIGATPDQEGAHLVRGSENPGAARRPLVLAPAQQTHSTQLVAMRERKAGVNEPQCKRMSHLRIECWRNRRPTPVS